MLALLHIYCHDNKKHLLFNNILFLLLFAYLINILVIDKSQ